MLIFGLDLSVVSKIDLDALAHDSFAIEDLTDSNGRVFVEEGDDYAAEGAQGCPRVDWRRSVDEVFDGLEVVGAEDLRVLEVRDEESIGGWCWHGQRRDGGEVYRHRCS